MGNIDGRIRFLEQYLRHAECPIKELRCFVCEKPISGYELSRMAPGEYPKHEGCSKVYNHQNCDVCKQQFIPVYSEHPWWRHKYCVVHGMDGTPECFSCGRVMSDCSGGKGKACCDCSESAVTCMESEEWHSLVANVHHLYQGLNMSFGEHPLPLFLVDAPSPFGTCAFHKDKGTPTRILILRGLPRLLCGAVLAHEMMHAWLRLQGYPPLPHHVEEGICQVLAHMWLDSQPQPQPDPDPRIIFQNNLTKFSRQLIAASPHPDGHAFRQAQHSIINYGLHTTLAHLRTAATLPPNDICSCTFMHYLHSYYH